MNGNYLNKILKIEAKHALYHENGRWFHNLKKFPGVLFDKNGYVKFDNVEAYSSHPSLQSNKDLFIKDGLASLIEYTNFSEIQHKLIKGINIEEIIDSKSLNEPIRIIREISTILRKQSLVTKIKSLYDNSCQVCGSRLKIGKDMYYSEVHHIIPLGNPYKGKDKLTNMLCVCPNHHASGF